MRSVLAVFPTLELAYGQTGKYASKRYEYFVPEGDEPKVGDFIITSLSPKEDKLLNFATVIEVLDEATSSATKSYLMLVPVEVLKDRQKREAEIREAAKAREQALKRLRELAEAKMLIESLRDANDPEIQALIAKIEGRS